MKPPVISIVQRGHKDKSGYQRLFLRYAWCYRTNYMILSWKLLPKDWDRSAQSVKPRATLGGETSMIVNSDLAKTMQKAFSVVAELIANQIPPTFDEFKIKMDMGEKVASFFCESAIKILEQEKSENQISKQTYICYKAAVNKFREIAGDLRVHEVNKEKITAFRRKMIVAGKENMANQYLRYLKIMYTRVLKSHNLNDLRKPFEGVSIKVVKISEKKSLSIDEYLIFKRALANYAEDSLEHDIIRRFLIMCRGLRFSDTVHLKKDLHHFEFVDSETKTTFRYLAVHAQKTGTKGIVPISETDGVLLKWQPDGFLFKKHEYSVYVRRLKKLSLSLIGREITTHFGRHFTGDFILNSSEMDLDDVKAIIGVKSDRIAEIYAQKDIKNVLRKFYAAVADLESKSK